MELVEVENLTYSYPERDAAALSDVSLGLSAGEFVLLVGSSGSGKSTLLRALNGLVPHFYGGIMGGSVRILGRNTTDVEVRELSRLVGMVFQDPENQLVAEKPESEIAFGLENLGLEQIQMRKRVAEVMATLRLSPLRNKRTSELSGGQKQKLVLASVLAMHPHLLALDEPTSQLDPISADDFLATLKSLNDELGLAVILAEHRLDRCFHFADRVIMLDEGRVAFDGAPVEFAAWSREIESVPLPPITRLFLGNGKPDPPLNVKEGRMRIGAMATDSSTPANAGASAAWEAPSIELEGKPILRASNLWHIYDDGTEALKGVDLNIMPGESICVIGENGSGKTTLVKHFNGLLRPSRGKVELAGWNTADREVAELARTCQMLGQNPNLQLVSDTVEGELRATLEALEIEEDRWEQLTQVTLDLLQLDSYRKANPQELSCGQRELVALASVLVCQPDILVLDEPTRGVDQDTKVKLAAYLGDLNRDGHTVVLVTHDLEFAAECCDRVIMMGDGKILADGDKHRVLSESLFFTTQFNRAFRGYASGVVTAQEARHVLEVLGS